MIRWEYKRRVFTLLDKHEKREAMLNEYGEEGWELITYQRFSNGTVAIFKRPIETLSDHPYIGT